MSVIRIKGLGGFNEIGASGTQVEIFNGVNKNILVDSGIRMKTIKDSVSGDILHGSDGHNTPDVNIDAVAITHGHADHVGNLPYTLSQFPAAKVFMTRPTLAISSQMWNNTSHLMERGHIDSTPARRLEFAKGTQVAASNLNNAIKKPGWVEIFPGVEAYFGPAGHIRGAAFIVIKTGGVQVMFTGDISIFDSPTVKGMRLPEEFIGKLDAIFVESTYGDRILIPREEEEARMGYIVERTLDRGGICLATAFGVGRSQDVLVAQLNYGIELTFLDGMGQKFLDIFSDLEVGRWCDLDHSEGIDLANDPRILFVKDREHRQELIYDLNEPFSVVATAGMLIEGSCSYQFATKNGFLENPDNTLLLTGYQAENTEGREIEEGIEAGRPIRLGGREISVRANVPKRLQLSSHADGLQISDLVKKLKPKKVFILHGHERGRHGLERNLRNVGFRGEIHLPRNGEPIEI